MVYHVLFTISHQFPVLHIQYTFDLHEKKNKQKKTSIPCPRSLYYEIIDIDL